MKNYYGSLCTEMYEILHKDAPQDELEFYLSFAEPKMRILEALCGSGRFLIPFAKRGFNITGIDLSSEMINKLIEKMPEAKVIQTSIEEYHTEEKFDYIFISSGSVSLFTDMIMCKSIISKMRDLLAYNGKFVFAVDTIANKCEDSTDYKLSVSVETEEGYKLSLKSKSEYDVDTSTQYSPSIYELYDNEQLFQSENMDFQTHLYELGEMEKILNEIGFKQVNVYSSFTKEKANNNDTEMFLFECQ